MVCAVNGVAAGAGAALALACDIVIAADNASFIQSFCRLGLVPDSGGSWFLPRLAGHARAMGMAMLGDKISAQQALAWGMIWQVVPADELADRTQTLARHLATQPTYGLGLIKKALYSSAANSLDQQLDLGAICSAWAAAATTIAKASARSLPNARQTSAGNSHERAPS